MNDETRQKLMDDITELARQSAAELAERARATALDIASRFGDDEEENARERAEAQAARARADELKKKYEAGLTAMDAQFKDATSDVRQQARSFADLAKTEAGKMAEQAQVTAARWRQEAERAAQQANKQPAGDQTGSSSQDRSQQS